MSVKAGPGEDHISVDIDYYDVHGELIGRYGESLIGFAGTWRDVAIAIRHGLTSLGLDTQAHLAISPMVDLT